MQADLPTKVDNKQLNEIRAELSALTVTFNIKDVMALWLHSLNMSTLLNL